MRNRPAILLAALVIPSLWPPATGMAQVQPRFQRDASVEAAARRLWPDPAVAVPAVPRTPAPARWHHAGAAVGLVAVSALLDEPLQEDLQESRTEGKDDLARLVRRTGQIEVFGTVALGTLAVGLVSGDGRITRAGGRITGGLLLAGAVTNVLKPAVGRHRPPGGRGAWRFDPFQGPQAWPSGHTSTAFALATSVSDELRSPPVTVGLYSLAALTAWSRLNDNRHWLSDVVTGALVGITSAKIMNGRWSVLGLRAPRFLLEPDRAGVVLGAEF